MLGRRGFSFNTSRSLLSYMQQLSGRIIEEEMTIFFKKVMVRKISSSSICIVDTILKFYNNQL